MQEETYKRLTSFEREEISRGLVLGLGVRSIAKRLDRSTSTISREVRRNKGVAGYRAFSARNYVAG